MNLGLMYFIIVCSLVVPTFFSNAFVLDVSSATTVSANINSGCLSSQRLRKNPRRVVMVPATTKSEDTDEEPAAKVRVGCLLCDLPTPSLLLELSLAEGAIEKTVPTLNLDDVLSMEQQKQQYASSSSSLLDGALFVHTRVVDTSIRDDVNREQGSGKSRVICKLDIKSGWIPGGAYLGIGLANHLVGGYYWARGMGMGASLPAHGVFLSDPTSELYWKKRGPGTNPKETTEESSNSNDGKRSEWVDFVQVGDTVQLVPEDVMSALKDSGFNTLLGVRRIGRPLGADPIVEKIWVRCGDGWAVVELEAGD